MIFHKRKMRLAQILPTVTRSWLLSMLTCVHVLHACIYPVVAAAIPSMVAEASPMHEGRAAAGLLGRRLLHGPHKNPGAWPVCNVCKSMTCNHMGKCTGHCRKNGRLHNCASNIGAASGGNLPEFPLAFANPPYLGCIIPPAGTIIPASQRACLFVPRDIVAPPGFSPDVDGPGNVVSVCIPGSSTATPSFGACVCSFTSHDGNSHREELCEVSAAYEQDIQRLPEYIAHVALEYGLAVETEGDTDVIVNGDTAAVVLVFEPVPVNFTGRGTVTGVTP